ncbi:MAG: ABC transporter permease [Bacteroidota bacterium]
MKKQPPKFALRFLRWFCREDFIDEIEGDLIELFEKKFDDAPRKAKWRFSWQVLLHFRPDFIKPIHNPFFSPGMFRHNLLITYRSHLRNKTSFFINLIGMSTALICVLLIFLWVQDEMNVDKYNAQDDRLYQVLQNFQPANDIQTWEYSPFILAEAFKKDLPEIEAITSTNDRFYVPKGLLTYGDKHFKTQGIFTRENFFEIFTHPILRGDKNKLLTDRNSIVISDEMATRLFDSYDDAIGKTVQWSTNLNDTTFIVSGVFQSPPRSASKQFDVAVHFDWLIEADEHASDWLSDYAETYLILKEGTDVEAFNQKIAKYYDGKTKYREEFEIFVQKYSDRYLHGKYEDGKITGGRIEYVKLFSIIAFFILLIACINFMNLATAQASKKMKEIGVKKTIGASRHALTIQFLSASILMVSICLIAALAAIHFILPYFNELTAKNLRLSIDPAFWWPLLGIVLFTGLVAGSYPALYLSKFNPIKVLKGVRVSSVSEELVRKGLVVFQFALSVIFIVSILVVNEQMEFIQTKNMGYDRDNVLCFERPTWERNPQTFIAALKNNQGVANAANMYWSVLDGTDNQGGFYWDDKAANKKISFQSPRIGYDVIETMGMELLAGRSFSKEMKDNHEKIVINESAVKLMGLTDPVGQTIGKGKTERQIIGVVKDFHYGSIHHQVEPLILRFRNGGRDIMVKVKAGMEREAIEHSKAVFKEFHPGYPFEFSFLDEDFQALYEAEQKVSVLSKIFGLLAIIISCLGLFGLAAFTAEQRSKEIGVRKILGASTWGIVTMLSRDFTKLVVVAIVVALPISYFTSKTWLNNFAYQANLQWWFFALSAALILLIAWFTVGYQTWSAARINPVESLRDE